ncbi:hypothetical protein HTG_17530 [Natrinema mahii]|nr:hypothetical protein HTG_17530 [Natrinema mahii]
MTLRNECFDEFHVSFPEMFADGVRHTPKFSG